MRARPRRRRFLAAASVVLAAALALSGCSGVRSVAINTPAQVDAALPDATTQQLQDAVTSAMTTAGASGAIVGVWAPWSGTWVAGLGTQGVGGAPVSSDSEFRAGRMTRAMTCDVLYSFVAAGTVKLDDPVSNWVSGVPDLTDVTLGQLCDGTSGIGAYAPHLLSLWLNNPARVWNPHELASYGLGQPRTLTPGATYTGPDAGYVLLGLALERAGGQTASALLQQHVFGPLDLPGTRLPSAGSRADTAGVLPGFQSVPDASGALNCAAPLDLTTLSSSVGFTDSGVVTDIADLGRYAQALATGALVPGDVGRFGGALPAYEGAPAWFTAKGGAMQAGSLIGQYGSVPGYLTAAFSDPNTGLTVAVVLNNSAADAGIIAALAWELAAIASKAPAASGQSAPELGLPWTAQQFHDQIAAAAVCPPPAQ
ncbi:serine hydrolase domain-containing protein [Microbacterium sp. CJ88]|uniref:serine hydrolase domain-containing protein n=1 Tax=Microbacterium sp. CJ88 TaxID=3445672 RepID=UPI003F65D4BE